MIDVCRVGYVWSISSFDFRIKGVSFFFVICEVVFGFLIEGYFFRIRRVVFVRRVGYVLFWMFG